MNRNFSLETAEIPNVIFDWPSFLLFFYDVPSLTQILSTLFLAFCESALVRETIILPPASDGFTPKRSMISEPCENGSEFNKLKFSGNFRYCKCIDDVFRQLRISIKLNKY